MEQHARFLHALPADPLEDVNRLVYADWLEEQGHPLSELLRLQVAMRSLSESDARVFDMADRETEILQTHKWTLCDLELSLQNEPEVARALEERVLGISRRHPVHFECPVCNGTRARRWDVKNPLILHWVLNPGLAVNELLLGQRIPKVMLFCRQCMATLVRCVACRRLLTQQQIGQKPIGHWVRLPCPECGADIPLLRNLLAGLVVGTGKLAFGTGKLACRLLRRRMRR
jgi:uncharacterized protein (TIGR02996 family)